MKTEKIWVLAGICFGLSPIVLVLNHTKHETLALILLFVQIGIFGAEIAMVAEARKKL